MDDIITNILTATPEQIRAQVSQIAHDVHDFNARKHLYSNLKFADRTTDIRVDRGLSAIADAYSVPVKLTGCRYYVTVEGINFFSIEKS